MTSLGPRLVIAGTHSGVGKTTVATGVMAALRRRGLRVGAAKVGPDFIDPGYHQLATGRVSRNLDAWMSGLEVIPALAARAGDGCDVLVIEGVMGLFDGAVDGAPSSTAEIAVALDAPVVLVVDAASASTSVAAVVHGFATFDPRVQVAGVILNRVGSDSHEAMLRAALAPSGIPVLGALRRDPGLVWRDRHLGLVPVVERRDEIARSLAQLAVLLDDRCDLEGLLALARRPRGRSVTDLAMPQSVAPGTRIAVAAGPAFSFSYPDNLEALRAAGAELVEFDPCTAPRLPEACVGLVAGGGFPEIYGGALADNRSLLADVRTAMAGGLVVWAECGGLLWLSKMLGDHLLVGAIAARATMTDRLTLGYRHGVTRAATPLGPAGTAVRGHEFHYSTIDPAGGALALEGRTGASIGGFGSSTLLASYLHLHLAARPDLAERFVSTCAEAAVRQTALRTPYVG